MLLLYFHLHPCTLYSTRVPFSLVMEGIPNEFIAHFSSTFVYHIFVRMLTFYTTRMSPKQPISSLLKAFPWF